MVRTVTRFAAATVVLIITGVIAALIVLAIVLVLADANTGNMIVNAIVEIGDFFTTPFQGMFPQSDAERDVLVNWGIAALAYVLIGGIIARIAR